MFNQYKNACVSVWDRIAEAGNTDHGTKVNYAIEVAAKFRISLADMRQYYYCPACISCGKVCYRCPIKWGSGVVCDEAGHCEDVGPYSVWFDYVFYGQIEDRYTAENAEAIQAARKVAFLVRTTWKDGGHNND